MNNEQKMTEQMDQDAPGRIAVPRADIVETPEAFVVNLDLPGARKETISLTLEQNVLQVKAEVESRHGADTNLLHRELWTAGYKRAFTLGEGVDRGTVDAVYADGVLTVKLFKTPETQPRTININ
jgi:HSP20 family protein